MLPFSSSAKPYQYRLWPLLHQYIPCGAKFVTSDVQFVNYTNIWSEGIDSR